MMKSAQQQLWVLHEYDPRSHYVALEHCVEKTGLPPIRRAVLRPRHILQGFKRGGLGFAWRQLQAVSLFGRRNDTVICGVAPYHPLVALLERIRRSHRLILHTSWPYWDGSFHPWGGPTPGYRDRWSALLKDLEVVCVTQQCADGLKLHGAEPVVIPHCVDTELFRPAHTSPARFRVLFVGFLAQRKGVLNLIELAERPPFRDVEFLFAGQGPLRDKVDALANGRSLGQLSASDLAAVYQSASCLVLPSQPTDTWTELFGMVLIEAMASGLPVIATQCPGPSAIVHPDTGYLVAPGDVNALAERLLELKHDSALAQSMGRAGRSHSVDRYDTRVVANRWVDLLL